MSTSSSTAAGASLRISVIVPVYNSVESLDALVLRLQPVLDAIGCPYEMLLVNDGSRDGSWDKIRLLAGHNRWIRGINLMRNYGQHNALLCGIRSAQGELIVTIDDDLQHPPEEIPKLLERLLEGHDVVYGTPREEQHGLWRDVASRITKLALASTMGAKTASQVSAFRVFRTHLRDAFANYRGSFVSIDVLLTWATTRFSAVPVRHEVRKLGKSNYTFRKLVTHALNMMTGFSTLPLQLASLMGVLCALFGVLILVYVIGRYIIRGGSVPGFPFLASTIAIFSGAQLLALGVMGEYLARIHFRTMDKPSYSIGESVGARPEAEDERTSFC